MAKKTQRPHERTTLPPWALDFLRKIKDDDPTDNDSVRHCKRLLEIGDAPQRELSRAALALEAYYASEETRNQI